MISLVLLGLDVWVSYVYLGCYRFGLSGTRLVPEMIYYVKSWLLNSIHTLTIVSIFISFLSLVRLCKVVLFAHVCDTYIRSSLNVGRFEEHLPCAP